MKKRGGVNHAGLIGVVILAIVVIWLLFFGGGKMLFGSGNGGGNVEAVSGACYDACDSGEVSAFCTLEREVIYGMERTGAFTKGTCSYISMNPSMFPGLDVAECGDLCKDVSLAEVDRLNELLIEKTAEVASLENPAERAEAYKEVVKIKEELLQAKREAGLV